LDIEAHMLDDQGTAWERFAKGWACTGRYPLRPTSVGTWPQERPSAVDRSRNGALARITRPRRRGAAVVVIAEWTTSNTIALAAVLVAVVAIGGNVAAQLLASRDREVDRRETRQRVAVLALGEADGLLVDVHPSRLENDVGLSRERLDAEQHRWLSTVRPGLSAIALGYPTERERDLASRLAGLLGETYNLHRWYVIGREQDGDPDTLAEVRERATDRHRRAVVLLDELAAAIRGDIPGEAS